MIADTCTTLRIFSCTTTSFIAAWAPSEPPAMPTVTGKPAEALRRRTRAWSRNSRSANADSSRLGVGEDRRRGARRASTSPLRSSGPGHASRGRDTAPARLRVAGSARGSCGVGPHHPLDLPQVVDDRQRSRPPRGSRSRKRCEIVDGAQHLGLLEHAVRVALDEHAHRRGAGEARVHDGVVSPHGAARREELAQAVVDVHAGACRAAPRRRAARRRPSTAPGRRITRSARRRERGCRAGARRPSAARSRDAGGGSSARTAGMNVISITSALRMPNAIRSPKTRTLVTLEGRQRREAGGGDEPGRHHDGADCADRRHDGRARIAEHRVLLVVALQDLHGVTGGDRQDGDRRDGAPRVEGEPEPAHDAEGAHHAQQRRHERQEHRLHGAERLVVHEPDHQRPRSGKRNAICAVAPVDAPRARRGHRPARCRHAGVPLRRHDLLDACENRRRLDASAESRRSPPRRRRRRTRACRRSAGPRRRRLRSCAISAAVARHRRHQLADVEVAIDEGEPLHALGRDAPDRAARELGHGLELRRDARRSSRGRRGVKTSPSRGTSATITAHPPPNVRLISLYTATYGWVCGS